MSMVVSINAVVDRESEDDMETTKSKECLGKCPKCDSENIDYAASEIIDNTLRYPAECVNCGQEFYEDYNINYFETHYL